jgi:hypothetical protein
VLNLQSEFNGEKEMLEAKLIASATNCREFKDVPPPVTIGKSNVLVQHVLVMCYAWLSLVDK